MFEQVLFLHVQTLERYSLPIGIHQVIELRVQLETSVGSLFELAWEVEEDALALVMNHLHMRLINPSRRWILLQFWVVDTPADGPEAHLLLLLKKWVLSVLDLALIPDAFTELLLEVALDTVIKGVQGLVFELGALGKFFVLRLGCFSKTIINIYALHLRLFARLKRSVVLVRCHFFETRILMAKALEMDALGVAVHPPALDMLLHCLTVDEFEGPLLGRAVSALDAVISRGFER